MPIYEYKCAGCGKVHEIMQKITEAPITACPECGGAVKKMISNTSFVLKGTGWYATDYASKGSGTSGCASRGEKESGNGSKKDTAKTEAKTEPPAPATTS